jgi:hypothetical protein
VAENWQADNRFARRFVPHMQRILAPLLICEAAPEDDQQRNTDLLILRGEVKRVACRVRRHEYLRRFPGEFTLRCSRPQSGLETELDKVVRGFGDYFLYGFAEPDDDRLAAWFVGDLNVFRLWYSQQIVRGRGVLPGRLLANADRSSDFRAFRLADLPPAFAITEVCFRPAQAQQPSLFAAATADDDTPF